MKIVRKTLVQYIIPPKSHYILLAIAHWPWSLEQRVMSFIYLVFNLIRMNSYMLSQNKCYLYKIVYCHYNRWSPPLCKKRYSKLDAINNFTKITLHIIGCTMAMEFGTKNYLLLFFLFFCFLIRAKGYLLPRNKWYNKSCYCHYRKINIFI
jgi:hypothetical protein